MAVVSDFRDRPVACEAVSLAFYATRSGNLFATGIEGVTSAMALVSENGSNSIRSVSRALQLLRLMLDDKGQHSLSRMAKDADLPLATAYRIAETLAAAGFLFREKRGYYLCGPTLCRISAQVTVAPLLSAISRPILADIVRGTGLVAHLGVFEDDMVTYLVKEGSNAYRVSTCEGMQLEAYFTAIGKVLLAHLSEPERNRYLSDGPFVPMTDRTIIDPTELERTLCLIRDQGYAVDDREAAQNLRCIAVPVRAQHLDVVGAISLTCLDDEVKNMPVIERLPDLRRAAEAINEGLAGS